MSEQSVRIDIWLWRARLARTRGLTAALVERGAVRLTHHGRQTRLDKPSRVVRPGDEITFVIDGNVRSLRVMGLGDRRGSATEARSLYIDLEDTIPAADSYAGQSD